MLWKRKAAETGADAFVSEFNFPKTFFPKWNWLLSGNRGVNNGHSGLKVCINILRNFEIFYQCWTEFDLLQVLAKLNTQMRIWILTPVTSGLRKIQFETLNTVILKIPCTFPLLSFSLQNKSVKTNYDLHVLDTCT